MLREDQLDDFDVLKYYRPVYPRLLRFRGSQPPAARATVARLRPGLREAHALTERVVRSQPAGVKARNLLRKINYELRWRGRTLDPLARRLVR